MPHNEVRILAVALNESEAKSLRLIIASEQVFGGHRVQQPTLRVIVPGHQIGSRFETVIVCVETYKAIMADPWQRDWFETSVRTRLTPTGRIVFVG